jgi:hypothetical protein
MINPVREATETPIENPVGGFKPLIDMIVDVLNGIFET